MARGWPLWRPHYNTNLACAQGRTGAHTRAHLPELTIPNIFVVLKQPAHAPVNSTAPVARRADQRSVQTRRSGVHGKGVFALRDLAPGRVIMEYTGEVISWAEALRRHPHDPTDPNHTFYFHINDTQVIDAKVGGNSARWINHSCAPNCVADEVGSRVFIKTLRSIAAGEELFYDYGLIIDARYTRKLLADYPCWCGAPHCRGTLLAPKATKTRASAAMPHAA